MSPEDLKREWKTEMNRPVPGAALDDLANNIERALRRDGARRCIGAICGRPSAACWVSACSRRCGRSIGPLPQGFSVLSDLAAAAFIIYMLMSARRGAPSAFHASVLDCSRNRLAWLDRQIRLLRTVAWWYIAPLFGVRVAELGPLSWGVARLRLASTHCDCGCGRDCRLEPMGRPP